MSYRCPTCTTQYRTSPKDPVRAYARCRVCGFLIDVAANSRPDAGGDPAPVEPSVRRWPFFVAALLLLLALAWVVAVAQRSL